MILIFSSQMILRIILKLIYSLEELKHYRLN